MSGPIVSEPMAQVGPEHVNINLRLSRAELEAVDRLRPSTVPRTHWIRGAVRLRLDAHQELPEGHELPAHG